MRFLLPVRCLVLTLLPSWGLVAQTQPIDSPTPPAKAIVDLGSWLTAAPGADGSLKYRLQVKSMEVNAVIQRLAKLSGNPIRPVSYVHALVKIDLEQASFEQAFQAICAAANLSARKNEDGSFIYGYGPDIYIASAEPDDANQMEITYRSRHLNSDSIASVLAKTFPDLVVLKGPTFLSPVMEAGNTISTDGSKALGSTEEAFKTHDVVISGPAGRLKRALILAQRLDRPRRQVRINARLTEVSGTLDSVLGVSWSFGNLAFQEIPDKDLSAPQNSIKGIKFGTFAHSAASIGAAIQAQESKGKARTLANPSITLVDGERSFILIGERRLFPKQTGSNSQGLPIFDVAEVRTGVYLQVSVQIGLDDDLTLTLYPQVSSVTSTVTINNSQYPIIATREAQTTVSLRSGEMMVIGGLVHEQEDVTETRVPLLGHIPILGELFTQRAKNKHQSELLVLITPELIPTE